MGESLSAVTVGVTQTGKLTAQHTLRQARKVRTQGGSPHAPFLLPPAVEEPASSHTPTLRNASATASAGFCKCLFHTSCRTSLNRRVQTSRSPRLSAPQVTAVKVLNNTLT